MLDPLTLDQLRVLVAVAETGSFSAAARRLGRVQSAISQAVQTLESTLGTALFERGGRTPKLTEAGKVMLADAHRVLQGVDALRARAESIAHELEPELTLAVDALFPNAVLVESLKALNQAFPCLPVTLFTEGLGAVEQCLRDGMARLAICSPLASEARGLESMFLAAIAMVPVVAASHPLAAEPGPLSRQALEPHIQLVLTDRSPLSAGRGGGIYSARIWRFADLASRLDFLLAGFGWCNMPVHLVERHLAAGALKQLEIQELAGVPLRFPLNVVHERGREPGRAGRWLIDDLRRRLPACDPSHISQQPAVLGAPAGQTRPRVVG
jgi:DNA-binding transcriptional LysR family regulator